MKNLLQSTKAKIIINLKQLGDDFGNFGNLHCIHYISQHINQHLNLENLICTQVFVCEVRLTNIKKLFAY